MSGKHEKAAIARLQGAAIARLASDIDDAIIDLEFAPDVLTALKASAHLLMVYEAIAEQAGATCKALRVAMAEVMGDTGATAVDLPHHRVALVDGKPSVIITDPAALPPQYMVQPPPKADTAAILRDLKRMTIPGATLANTAQHIRISSKKDAAA